MQTISINKAWSAAESVATPIAKPIRKIWLASLGAATLARKEAAKVIDKLIEEGTEFEGKARAKLKRTQTEAANKISGVQKRVSQATEETVEAVSRKASAIAKEVVKPAFYHLVPEDEKWAVRREGHDANISLHTTKQAALDAARGIAQAHEPSHLVVHRADGTIQTTYSYGTES